MRSPLWGRPPRDFRRIVLALAIAALANWAAADRATGSENRRTSTVVAVERVAPAVVNIHGQKTLTPSDEGYQPGEGPQRVNGMGTGVIIDERGYILTNNHVVDGVKKIQVTLDDGQTFVASLVSSDSKTDLALIRIATPDPLPTIPVGTSSDLMKGEPVIALGNPYGYESTVTRGIISSLKRTVQVSDTQSYRDLIQTDASINPGNSGGPLVNIDGEMIGINVAVRAGAQGIGFAIPVDTAIAVAANLMSVEKLDSNWHGVVAKSEANRRGLVIDKLADDSPAAGSGLKPGDVVLGVDDRSVERPLDFERALLGHKPGEALSLAVQRGDQRINVPLALAALPKSKLPVVDRTWELIGLRMEAAPSRQFQKAESRYRGGLSVTAVRPDSPAARQGIRRGDVLVGMHVWETVSLKDVAYVINRLEAADIEPLKFYIIRGHETLYGHMTVSHERK